MSDDAAERQAYMDACRADFAAVDLVFLDPDNGLNVPSVRLGQKNSSKYVYLDEIAAFYGSGKSVLVYQHFPRVERNAFIVACGARLQEVAPDAVIWAFRTGNVVFLLLIHPRSSPALREAARTASSRWEPSFMSGTPIQESGEEAIPEEEPPAQSQSPLGRLSSKLRSMFGG